MLAPPITGVFAEISLQLHPNADNAREDPKNHNLLRFLPRWLSGYERGLVFLRRGSLVAWPSSRFLAPWRT